MLPLQPTHLLAELARNSKPDKERIPAMYSSSNDPDRFFPESTSMQPDPLYMTLREGIARGPIGRFFAWLDARAEAREEREMRPTSTSTPVRFSPHRETAAPDRDDLAA